MSHSGNLKKYLLIIRLLQENKSQAPPLKAIQQHLENHGFDNTSARTLSRDFQALKAEFGINIQHNLKDEVTRFVMLQRRIEGIFMIFLNCWRWEKGWKVEFDKIHITFYTVKVDILKNIITFIFLSCKLKNEQQSDLLIMNRKKD